MLELVLDIILEFSLKALIIAVYGLVTVAAGFVDTLVFFVN